MTFAEPRPANKGKALPLPGNPAVIRFAAYLAHLLNGKQGEFELQPAVIYDRLIRALSGLDGVGREASQFYRDRLIGYGLVARDATAEQLAVRYFDTVIDRPLHLKANRHTHYGHALLLALCRRGREPAWEGVRLERSKDVPALSDQPLNASCSRMRLQLRSYCAEPAHHNPAGATRQAHGPLYLMGDGFFAEVPEELSLWKAILCAPKRLRAMAPGPEFNEFCSLVIKAFEAAHAPYGAVLALGLSPFEWSGELTTNTAKAIHAFLSEVRRLSEAAGTEARHKHDLEIWRRAWEKRKVPGFASAEAFWQSEAGRAIRDKGSIRFVAAEEIDLAYELEPFEGYQSYELFLTELERAHAAGFISRFDADFLARLHRTGLTIEEIAGDATLARHFGSRAKLRRYLEELDARLQAYAKEQED